MNPETPFMSTWFKNSLMAPNNCSNFERLSLNAKWAFEAVFFVRLERIRAQMELLLSTNERFQKCTVQPSEVNTSRSSGIYGYDTISDNAEFVQLNNSNEIY